MAEQGESFVRWQGITREQFTVATSVILGLAVSALGYQAAALLDDKVTRVSFGQFGCVVSLAISVGAGICLVINRLHDFRLTTRLARLREKREKPEDVKSLEVITERLGARSWRLLNLQIWTFLGGLALFTVHLVESIWPKL